MENKRTYQIPEGVVLAHVCDYPVLAVTRDLIEQNTTAACILNETGEFIWHCVEKGWNEQEVMEAVVREYEASKEDIRAGVKAFLNSMAQQGLLIPGDLQ